MIPNLCFKNVVSGAQEPTFPVSLVVVEVAS